MGRIVILTTMLFFIPSLIMGMVSPVVVKLALTDLSHSGNVVGKIYAFSTLGSIFGTFITGFVLDLLVRHACNRAGCGNRADRHGFHRRQAVANAEGRSCPGDTPRIIELDNQHRDGA